MLPILGRWDGLESLGSGSVIPATAGAVTDRLWEMTDVVEMIEAWEATEQRKAA